MEELLRQFVSLVAVGLIAYDLFKNIMDEKRKIESYFKFKCKSWKESIQTVFYMEMI